MCETREIENQSENDGAIEQDQPRDLAASKVSATSANFDTALAELKFGKFNYFLIIVAGGILSCVLFETLGISYVLPVTDCDLNLSTEQKGILSAIGFIGIITSSHLWGFLADTKGRRQIIRPTLLVAFSLGVISSFINNFWALVALRFLNGFFVSGGSATIYAYLGEFHTNKFRSKAIMGASVIFGVGALLMPAFAWAVINQSFQFYIPFLDVMYKPWRLFLVVSGLPSLLCALCLFIIPESPKFTLLYKGQEEAIEILRSVYAINTGNSRESYPITHIYETEELERVLDDDKRHPIMNIFASMWRQTAPLFQKQFIGRTLLCCLLQFVTFLTANGMYMWFPGILDQLGQFRIVNPNNYATICQVIEANKMQGLGVNLTDTSFMMPECKETLDIATYQYSILLEILYIISFALFGFVINAVGKIPILFIIFIGSGASAIALAFVTIPLLAIYMFVVLMLSGLATVVVNAATVDLFPTNLRAMAVCITLMFGRSGSVIGANIAGLLLNYSCQTAFLFSGITLIFGGFLGFLIPKSLNEKAIDVSNKSRKSSITSRISSNP